MFSINAQFDINTKKIWKGCVNIWGAVAPLSPPLVVTGYKSHVRISSVFVPASLATSSWGSVAHAL